MEHRASRRIPRRLKAAFGPVSPTQTGFTQDVSETGAFITTNQLPRLGMKLVVELESSTRVSRFVGEVVRHVIVPPELRSIRRHGFGLRFVSGRAEVKELLDATAARTSQPLVPSTEPTLTFASPDEYQRLRAQQLVHGALSVLLPSPVQVNQSLELTVRCAWRDATAKVKGRVVLVQSVDGKHQVTLLVDDKAALLQQLDGLAAPH
jgi:hypothetical protein